MKQQSTSYDKVITYLFEMLPAYQRIGSKAFKKDLSNIIALCTHLGDPQNKFPTIHVAGSNGKGSVANMLASIFQEAGFKTGLYTSPHILDFTERIQINGQPIHKNSVIGFVRRVRSMIDSVKPSFFELTVALAFDQFKRKAVDIAIVETGLGGRLDSTNILHPELSIITNISLEHQAILGNTLKEIAGEKAGIIKDGTPVIIGKSQRETAPVFKETAKGLKAVINFADQMFEVTNSEYISGIRTLQVTRKRDNASMNIKLDLSAAYQIENTLTVLAAVDQINEIGDFKLNAKAVRMGLKRTMINNLFRGRWQLLQDRPKVIADGSHNVGGFKKVREQLLEEDFHHLHIIYGCVAEKDLTAILPLLPKSASYYLTEPHVERARKVKELKQEFSGHGLLVTIASKNPKTCLDHAIANSTENDMILITGSIFLLSSFI